MLNYKNEMEIEGSYIQYAGGYNKDNVTILDIKKAIVDLNIMDGEHGAFWVGIYNKESDEIALEVHKDLTLFGHFGENQEDDLKTRLESNLEIEGYFKLLLNGEIEKLKVKMKNN